MQFLRSSLHNFGPPTQRAVSLWKDDNIKGQTYIQVVFPAKPAKFGINVWEGAIVQNGCVHEVKIIPANMGEQNGCLSGTRSLPPTSLYEWLVEL